MSTDNANQTDIVRVLRVIEYTGPRNEVERDVARSIHGEKIVNTAGTYVIRAATIGEFPEILERVTPRETECAMENDHMCALYKNREPGEAELTLCDCGHPVTVHCGEGCMFSTGGDSIYCPCILNHGRSGSNYDVELVKQIKSRTK